MVRDPYRREEAPEPAAILAALADEDARTILQRLDEPMTAQELKRESDIPESTLYRKLDMLTSTGLLDERTRLRRDGHHANEYAPAFAEITVSRDDETGSLQVDLTPRKRAPDERLAELWSEVGQEV